MTTESNYVGLKNELLPVSSEDVDFRKERVITGTCILDEIISAKMHKSQQLPNTNKVSVRLSQCQNSPCQQIQGHDDCGFSSNSMMQTGESWADLPGLKPPNSQFEANIKYFNIYPNNFFEYKRLYIKRCILIRSI